MKIALYGLALFATIAMMSCQGQAKADGKEAARQAVETVKNTADKAGEVITSTTPSGPTTAVNFAELEYNYGTVPQGEKVAHTYKFTNTGKEPLIISNAKGSCGCTVPQWPKEPIAPGEDGEILVEFDSKGKSGNQTKTVTITANTEPAQTFLKITGVVEAPAAQ